MNLFNHESRSETPKIKKGTGLTKAEQEKNERKLLLQIKGLKDNEENLIKKVEQLQTELKDVKSDYKRTKTELREAEDKMDKSENCTNQYRDERDDACYECDSSKTLNLVLLGVIAIFIIGWWMR